MQRKGVDVVHDGYGSEKDLGRLSCCSKNLSGTSSSVIQFRYCSLGSFTFKYEFLHQFCSLVAFILPKSVPKPILTEKKEKKSHLALLNDLDLLCLQGKNESCGFCGLFLVLFFFPENITYFFSVHWKFRDSESQVGLLAQVRRETEMQFFRVNIIFDML